MMKLKGNSIREIFIWELNTQTLICMQAQAGLKTYKTS